MADLPESVKQIKPQQWLMIGAAGLGIGLIWRYRNKTKTTVTPVDTSALDQTAPTAGFNAGYSGVSPTTPGGGAGNISFTPGGSQFPVTLSGYTAEEAQNIIGTLIPKPVVGGTPPSTSVPIVTQVGSLTPGSANAIQQQMLANLAAYRGAPIASPTTPYASVRPVLGVPNWGG